MTSLKREYSTITANNPSWKKNAYNNYIKISLFLLLLFGRENHTHIIIYFIMVNIIYSFILLYNNIVYECVVHKHIGGCYGDELEWIRKNSRYIIIIDTYVYVYTVYIYIYIMGKIILYICILFICILYLHIGRKY